MKEIESISAALFDKIRSRFGNVTLGDENAKAETDPEKARFFNFTYTGEDGAEFGTVTISLIDEQSLKVYYGYNITADMDRSQREEWYGFLRNIRKFAKRNLLTFDTRDINKSNLELKDVKQQSKADDTFRAGDVAVTESRLYGSPGRPYNSFGEKGRTKLLIRHQEKVNEEVPGARTRKIESIFIENEIGERFKLPHNNLTGAWALAEHLNQGGSIYDDFAEHINGMVSEMRSMRHFVRATKNRQFEDKETVGMTEAAIGHYNNLRETLRHLRSPRFYKEYREFWKPALVEDDDVDVASLRERFVKKIYDDRFNEALPIVYRAYKRQKNESVFGEELESWYDDFLSEDKEISLDELMASSIMVGIDGVDAIRDIGIAIPETERDEDFQHALYHLSISQGPDADARPLLKTWLQQNNPEALRGLSIGPNNADDASTNYVPQASPEVTNNKTGVIPSHPNVSNMTMEHQKDPLDFIRSLAGIKK